VNFDPTTQLSKFVLVFRDLIEPSACDEIIETSKDGWLKHSYSYPGSNQYESFVDDPDVCAPSKEIVHSLNSVIKFVMKEYLDYLDLNKNFAFTNYSSVRLNKYQIGQRMKKHNDHIGTIFSETGERGIPILSFVGLLNDDYEGGEFVMWDNTIISIPKGGVVAFPSLFLYPHEVRQVTAGIRNSFVSWAW